MSHGFFVAIIESPSSRELLEGKMEGMALSSALNLADIDHEYYLAVTPEAFCEALARIEAGTRLGRTPILHLSMHGNERGVGLTTTPDHSIITWEMLANALDRLHQLSSHCMTVCLSACRGLMARHMDTRYYALIGSSDDVALAAATVGFVAFYYRIFTGASYSEAVEALRLASGIKSFDIQYGSVPMQSSRAGQ